MPSDARLYWEADQDNADTKRMNVIEESDMHQAV